MNPVPGHKNRYTLVAILLHWISALLIVFMLVLGPFMKRFDIELLWRFELYQLHKSIGISLFLLTLFRLGWRLSHRPPEYEIVLPQWAKTGAAIVHWTLYALLLIIPVSGWALVSTAEFNVPTIFFGMLEIPHMTYLHQNAESFRSLTHLMHTSLTIILGLLVIGHIAAAFVHSMVFRDKTVERMLPFPTIAKGRSKP